MLFRVTEPLLTFLCEIVIPSGCFLLLGCKPHRQNHSYHAGKSASNSRSSVDTRGISMDLGRKGWKGEMEGSPTGDRYLKFIPSILVLTVDLQVHCITNTVRTWLCRPFVLT
jgi:hypothetical protein